MKTSYPAFFVFALFTASGFAEDSTKSEPARTGQGKGIYKVVRNWPKYPEGKKLGNLHGDMAADSKGKVYIATGGTIQVIAADGTYEGELRAKNGNKAFRGVHGMKVRKIDGEETLIIAMPGVKRVVNVRFDGTVVWQIIGPPKVEGMYGSISQYNPTDLDVAPDGRVYIVDGYGKSLVHVYDKDRKYLKTFGGKGKEDGKFNICHNILIDTRSDKPSLLISDRQNNRLQLHDMDGNFIRTIDSKLGRPCAADIHGELLAVGELDGRVSLYDKDNKLISRLGDEPKSRKKAGNGVGPADWHEGALIAVHGCTFDAKGDLYAQEWNVHGRLTKYTKVK
ncbi:MAG: hypothetical protein GY899_10965 [Verrucomicrobiaceae bacterium]|nr:hypothetical protein [Verrucomicrobiaceae bacterium]